MKNDAKFEQVRSEYATSFLYYHSRIPCHSEWPLHFHPELEISYIAKGSGYRIMGDFHEQFKEGEVILIPSNIPHCWIYSSESCQPDGDKESFFIQFSPDVLSRGMVFFKELKIAVQRLLVIQQGIKIGGKSAEEIKNLLVGMQRQDVLNRLFAFMRIIQIIGESEALYPIGIKSKICYGITSNMERTQIIFKYIMEHYREKIELSTIAGLVNMSDTAFCRYFKNETGKTFIAYINEYRIEIACSLLKECMDKDISEVAWLCGFTDIPYFNRYFKKMKGVTPKEWRNG